MKLIFLILLSMFLSCCSVKKEYVCGDRPCLDKKDFKEYFSKNLSIEIKPQEKNKTLSADLVKINTKSFAKNKKENIDSKKSKRLELKENKRKLKIERKRLKEEKTRLKEEKTRLIKERKIKAKADAKITKISKSSNTYKKIIRNKLNGNVKQSNKIFNKISADKKTTLIKDVIKNKPSNSQINNNPQSICGEIKDCDIDKITELLINRGKNKPFPNISSN
jgi:hypothetical protein